jgi:hypothetical protein
MLLPVTSDWYKHSVLSRHWADIRSTIALLPSPFSRYVFLKKRDTWEINAQL